MPELPEVQTIVNGLNKKIVGRKITGVWFDAPKIIKGIKLADFKKQIKGLKIEKISRRGKNILIYLSKDYLLLVHQKMTGHLLYGKWGIVNRKTASLINGSLGEKVNGYIHLIFYLDNGWQLALSDLRKFAKVLFGKKDEIKKMPDLAELGSEPLDKNFTLGKFEKIIGRVHGKIKQVLMNQKVIVGIGNIYADEILYEAGIHPFRLAYKLNNAELKKIYLATKKILKKAIILRGTSTSDFRDISGIVGKYGKKLLVYRKEGENCLRHCGGIVKRVKIGGRSAHYCPNCQKL